MSAFSTSSRPNLASLDGFSSSPESATPVGSSNGSQKTPSGFGSAFAGNQYPSIIPPSHPARTLVLCFDGTGDQFDADNSNVVQFFSMLKKDDRSQQMVYYQAGIGTYTAPQVATPFMAKIEKTLDEMIAWNLDAHVMAGYEFLMQNYEAGDKICIFGFSRGAYTARALAGMIHKIGLLPACNHQQVPFAYKMFSRCDKTGWDQSTAFKKAFSVDVDIEFIGVWDTVASVGLIPRRLPFTASNTAIKTFRHAVSLDERRSKFKANLFNRTTFEEEQLGVQHGEMPKSTAAPALDPHYGFTPNDAKHVPAGGKDKDGHKVDADSKKLKMEREMERHFSLMEGKPLETDVLEVWFAGCHCDVGGGSVPNNTRHNLARIPLRWMIRQCFATNTGIRFHTDLLKTVGLDPEALWPVVKPRPPPVTALASPSIARNPSLKFTGSNAERSAASTIASKLTAPTLGYACVGADDMCKTEEEEDFEDALCPIYDQLTIAKGWWVLEVIPMSFRVQQDDNHWKTELKANWGQGRQVPHGKHRPTFNVHRTVKLRMEAQDLEGGPYKMKAQHTIDPTWVD